MFSTYSDDSIWKIMQNCCIKTRFWPLGIYFMKILICLIFLIFQFFWYFQKNETWGGSISSKLNSHDRISAFCRLFSKNWRHHDQNRKKTSLGRPFRAKFVFFFFEIRPNLTFGALCFGLTRAGGAKGGVRRGASPPDTVWPPTTCPNPKKKSSKKPKWH